MNLYLIRHGESEGNKADVRQFPDMPLSEKGRSQASAIANRLSPLHFDKIMSSPFPRALDTAKKIGEKLSLQVETSELLTEVKKPSETWGMSHDEIQKHPHTRGFITNLHDPYWKYSDEENVFEFRSRVEKIIEMLVNCGSENIIVVTHGAVIRFIMAMVMLGKAISPQNFFSIYQKTQTANTGVTIIEYENDQWNLISFNDHAHLW